MHRFLLSGGIMKNVAELKREYSFKNLDEMAQYGILGKLKKETIKVARSRVESYLHSHANLVDLEYVTMGIGEVFDGGHDVLSNIVDEYKLWKNGDDDYYHLRFRDINIIGKIGFESHAITRIMRALNQIYQIDLVGEVYIVNGLWFIQTLNVECDDELIVNYKLYRI